MYNPHLMKTIRIVVLLILAFALLAPFDSVAYAQEGDPPPPPVTETEEPQQEVEDPSAEEPIDDPGDEAEPEESAPELVEEPAPTEEPVVEEAAPEPTVEVEEPAEQAAPVAEQEVEDQQADDQQADDQQADDQQADDQQADETDSEEEADMTDAVVAMNEGDIMLVDEDGEPLPMGSQAAAEALTAPDPMFCPEGEIYGGPTCAGGQTTFAAAIADAIAAGSNGTIYVEAGNYTEDVTIDGSSWTTTPTNFTIQSLGDSTDTTVTGNFTVTNMNDFTLDGFTIIGGLVFDSNTGTLTVTDVNVTNAAGDGMSVTNQTGDVVVSDSQFNDNGGNGLDVRTTGTVTVSNVQANNNLGGDGASILSDGATVTNSTFNNNTDGAAGSDYGNGLAIESSGGQIVVENVVGMYNEESGALLWFTSADPANEILVKDSSFKYNGEFGVWAQPESGTVVFDCVNLSGNTLGAKMVPVGESVVWVACPCDDNKKDDDEYEVKVPVSSETPTIVNPGNGTLITFPPVDIIDSEDDAWGKALPLTEEDLPAELPLGDIFKAGVDVQLINALLPPGSFLTVEFFVPGYLWDEDFAVLFWDADTGEWVEIPFTMEPHPRLPGGRIVAEWPQTGVFALVMR